MSNKPTPFAFKRKFGAPVNIPRILENNFTKPKDMIVIGGPCSVESPEQVDKIIPEIGKEVSFFRGGVFRAGHFPSKEFGLKFDLLKYYHQKTKEYGKPNIVEILDYRQIEKIEPYAGAFQVGMRAAQNYALLTELSKHEKPVFLKRGSWQTIDEWLGSLEYLIQNGKNNVYLIERGIVGIDTHTRWSLCLSSIPAINEICDVPVIADPCHGSGRRDIVSSLAYAGIACGAAGVLLENPDKSISDAEQIISFETFHKTVSTCKEIYDIVRR